MRRLSVVAITVGLLGGSCGGGEGRPEPLMSTATTKSAAAATTTDAAAATSTTEAQPTVPLPTEPTTVPPATVEQTTSTPRSPTLLSTAVEPFGAAETVQAALGDLDGDGDLDVVLANPRDNPATVWLGDGAGGFADSGQRLTLQGHGVDLADFDGDGDLDAFVTCHGLGSGMGLPSRLYRNDGSGSFAVADVEFGDEALSGVEVEVIDLQGDGRPDVYVSYFDPAGQADFVYVNDGAGVLADSGLRIDEDVVAWGDLDGDGDTDMFGKRIGEGYVVRANDGAGAFTEMWSMPEEAAAEGSIALADFDEDGDLDALIGNGREGEESPAQLLWNEGAGSFTPAEALSRPASLAEFGVADLDGDGHLDVVVANGDLFDEVWLGDGTGGFEDTGLRLGPLPPEGLSTTVTIGDLDNDGALDVIVGSLAAPARLYRNLSG